MRLAKSISLYIVIAFVFTYVSCLLNSRSLFDYLKANVIGLLLTLLAINTATSGLIASKMQDFVTVAPGFKFDNSIKEMKLSLKEQICLIVASIMILIIQDSKLIQIQHKLFICDTLLTAVLIYSVCILWDTGNAVFIVIEEIQKRNNSNS